MVYAIKGWAKFQHFKDRTPPWIKLYRDILNDPEWHELSGDAAKTLVMLWVIASEDESKRGLLPESKKLAFRLRITEKSLKTIMSQLNNWLIQLDISAISTGYHSDAPERAPKETERERETETEREGEREGETEIPPPEILVEAETFPVAIATGHKIISPDEAAIQSACQETWAAYSAAYAKRYGAKPVRNGKTNGQVKQFVKRLGAKEAPDVAAFFVGHANAFYVRNGHDIGSLLAGCEKLRTEWATGRMVTVTSAQQADRTQSNANAAREAIQMLKAEGFR